MDGNDELLDDFIFDHESLLVERVTKFDLIKKDQSHESRVNALCDSLCTEKSGYKFTKWIRDIMGQI